MSGDTAKWLEFMKEGIGNVMRRLRSEGHDIIKYLNEYVSSDPLYSFIGLEVLEVGDGYAKARFPYKQEILRRGGVVNGGVIMTVIDFTIGLSVMTINDGLDQFTAELKVNFMEPLKKGPFTSEARVIRMGRHLAIGEGQIIDADGRVCAKGLGTWFVVRQ